MHKTLHIEPMLFNYETTHKTDYRFGQILDYPKTLYKDKKGHKPRGAAEYKNTETLSQWQREVPPFSLLHKPKDIIRTNPYEVQQYIEKPTYIDNKEARKTRPRLVMPPAVSMDDIDDEHARNILCADMYTSTVAKAARDTAITTGNVKMSKPERLFPANPITLPKLKPSCVPPEWRMETVTWDKQQLRGYCDPTKEFWLTRKTRK